MDLAQQEFIKAFLDLRKQENEAAKTSTEAIQRLCSQASSFSALTSIISTSQDSFVRFQAVLSLRLFFKRDHSSSLTHDEVIPLLFSLITKESDELIMQNFVDVACKQVDKSDLQFIRQFAENAAKSGSSQSIFCATLILDSVIDEFSEFFSELGDYSQLLSGGLSAVSPSHFIASVSFACHFFQKCRPIVDGIYTTFWNSVVERLFSFYDGSLEDLKQLSRVIEDAIDDSLEFVDIEIVFTPLFERASKPDADIQTVGAILPILSACARFNPQFIIENGHMIPMFNLYYKIFTDDFDPDCPDELSSKQILCDFCEAFSCEDSFLNFFWKSISDMIKSPSGIATSLLILQFSFAGGYSFFADHIEDVVSILGGSLENPSVLIREADYDSIYEFINVFSNDVSDNIRTLEIALIQSIQTYASEESLNCLTSLMKAEQKTDQIFDAALPILFNLISSNLAHFALPCIATLALYSEEKVVANSNSIFSVMKDIISSDSEDLWGYAAECISSLSQTCKSQFSEVASDFASFLISHLNAENPSLCCTCMSGFRTLLSTHPNEIYPTIVAACEALVTLTESDINPQQIAEAEEDADDVLVSSDVLEISSLSCQTLVDIISTYHELISQTDLQYFINVIQKLSVSSNPESVVSSMKALTSLVETISDCEDKSLISELYNIALYVAKNQSDYQIVAAAFDSLGSMIVIFGIENESDIIELILKGLDSNTEELFSSLQFLISEVVKQNPESIAIIEKKAVAKLTSDDVDLCSFSLSIVNDIIENYGGDDNFMNSAIECALKILSEKPLNSVGYSTIRIISSTSPRIATADPFSKQILEIFNKTLNEKKQSSEEYLCGIDNCISAIGSFTINVSNALISEKDFVKRVFELMPAKVDFSQNLNIFQFYFWLLEQIGSQYREEAAAVLIRLFSIPKSQKEQMQLSDTSIAPLRKMLLKFLSSIQNAEQLCRTVIKKDSHKYANLQSWINEE